MKRFTKIEGGIIVDVRNGNTWRYYPQSEDKTEGAWLDGPKDEIYGPAADRLWQYLCSQAVDLTAAQPAAPSSPDTSKLIYACDMADEVLSQVLGFSGLPTALLNQAQRVQELIAAALDSLPAAAPDPSPWVGDKPKWEDVPDNYNWIAQDESGGGYGYQKKPNPTTEVWISLYPFILLSEANTNNPCWRETLEARPGKESKE